MEPSVLGTVGVLILSTVVGVLAAAVWATLNGVFLLPVALLPGARETDFASTSSKQFVIWLGVGVELISNTGFALVLCWACSRWVNPQSVYMWVIWLAAWLLANAPLRWNLRDVGKAREDGNHHLLHQSVALAYVPVKLTTALAIAGWAFWR